MPKPWAKLNLTACRSWKLFSLALFAYSSLRSFWSAWEAEAAVNGRQSVNGVLATAQLYQVGARAAGV